MGFPWNRVESKGAFVVRYDVLDAAASEALLAAEVFAGVVVEGLVAVLIAIAGVATVVVVEVVAEATAFTEEA